MSHSPESPCCAHRHRYTVTNRSHLTETSLQSLFHPLIQCTPDTATSAALSLTHSKPDSPHCHPPAQPAMSHAPSHLRIGIIGAGNIGQPLARLFTQAGHTVKIANSRGPETLADIAQRTGATAATVEEAVKNAQLVVVTIPQKAALQLAATKLFSQLPADTIVIDTCNYYVGRDGHIAELDEERVTQSGWVGQHLGHAVFKVFNNIYYLSLDTDGKPAGAPGRIALPVAGDNAAHKATIIALLDQIGFDGVDAGKQDESWRQQPGTPVYCTDLDAEGVKRALSQAVRSRSRAVQDIQLKEVMAAFAENAPKEKVIARLRQVMAEQYGK